MMSIPFNKPWLTGLESDLINKVLSSGKFCGNGEYTQKCQQYFQEHIGSRKCLLTTSCTDALEMCALLAGVDSNSQVIVPSYTFVSTALAFTRQGAKIVYADSLPTHPCIDPRSVEKLITPQTKAIVVVHYAGVACDMDALKQIANSHNIFLIEDAAQAIDSYYTGADGLKRPLGSIGHLAAFSFHETKNIQCGEGGLLAINHPDLVKRAEILWEKGTNRAEFFRGEINKYGWVDTGSSFLPNEYTAAFLWAQLQNLPQIQQKRKDLWEYYYSSLSRKTGSTNKISLPFIPAYATNNAHMFYITTKNPEIRTALIARLKEKGVSAVFHYLSLHKSKYSLEHGMGGQELEWSDYYTECLLRLPMFGALTFSEIDYITDIISDFCN